MGVVGTPSNLTGMTATALRKVAAAKKLREDSIRPSVFTALPTALKVVEKQIVIEKAGVFMQVDTDPDGPAQSARLAMAKPLNDAPVYGPAAKLGTEEDRQLLWTEVYYNEIFKATKYYKYGYYKNDTAYLNLIESLGPALSTYMAELRDDRIHQALLLRFGPELLAAPVSQVQQWNPNWLIPNLDEASFPAWDVTANTVTAGSADGDGYYNTLYLSGATAFTENIAAALMAASGTGSTPKNLMNVDTLNMISEYVASELVVEPIMLDGVPSYVLLVHPRVKAWMRNPNKSGSIAEYFKSVADYKDPQRITIPGEIGRVFDNLVIVEDHRLPTIVVGGGAGTYTITPGFCHPGNNDDRNKSAWSNTSGSTNYAHDINVLLGANAVAEYLVDPMNMKLTDSTEYEQIQGRGAYLGEGLQLPFFDLDSGSRLDGASKTMIYKGSAIIPTGRTARVTVS